MATPQAKPYDTWKALVDSGEPVEVSNRPFLALLIVFEIPPCLLVMHGVAYLTAIPGATTRIPPHGGEQPVAFDFFMLLASGGLLIPLILGVFLCFFIPTRSEYAAWKLGLWLGLSYLPTSVAWWGLIVLGVFRDRGFG